MGFQESKRFRACFARPSALILTLGFVATPGMSHAEESSGLLERPRLLAPSDATTDTTKTITTAATATATSRFPSGGLLIAQEDIYDPFADYSEFAESVEEEEDINFFRNGRLFTMGFIGGYRGWTQSLNQAYSSSPAFGLYLCYFFDLRFALQFGYLSSDSTLMVKGSDFATVQGTVSITDLQFVLKYYLNTQNVTRGLADLNPYLVGGFSQIYRTSTVSGNSNFAKDSAFAFNVGAGLEIPMMRNKMYFGVQGNYQLINFADENRVVRDENDVKTGVTLNGDSFLVLGILGINF